MKRTWKFSDIEFFVLWESHAKDALPSPLVFTSRTPLLDDFELEKSSTRDALRNKVDRSFGEVLETLAAPDIRITVDGWDGTDGDDPKKCVRLLAARRGDAGYVVKQLPGETIWHSGGFEVTECAAVGLADAVVAQMPEAAAGKLAEVVLATDSGSDMDYAFGESAVEDSFDDTVAYRSDKFLKTEATTIGTIAVVQGSSVFGPRGVTRREILWRDVVDDGRYASTPSLPSVAVGADAARLTAMINTEVATVVRAIKDERR
ncbi:ESX secretion-associated protein EspG [Nocardia sp. NPDC051787]|uniref:ESX secretion-associated protein EspG n=1 Tax=Nocardia sp. NPDC051787 TaxID=3155415 RepID=UPI003427FDF4